jgi:hypothetical protein
MDGRPRPSPWLPSPANPPRSSFIRHSPRSLLPLARRHTSAIPMPPTFSILLPLLVPRDAQTTLDLSQCLRGPHVHWLCVPSPLPFFNCSACTSSLQCQEAGASMSSGGHTSLLLPIFLLPIFYAAGAPSVTLLWSAISPVLLNFPSLLSLYLSVQLC